jgi:acyl carrier protein
MRRDLNPAGANGTAHAVAVQRLNALEKELADSIIEALGLPDVRVDDLRPDTPLYGEGLGLDSIDILEVALVVSRRYGFELRSDDPENERIFRSLGSLAEHIRRHRSR